MRMSSVSGGHHTERHYDKTLVTKSGFFFLQMNLHRFPSQHFEFPANL